MGAFARISIFLFFIALLLSQTAAAKTLYPIATWHAISGLGPFGYPNACSIDFGNPNTTGYECSPYPFSSYGPFATTPLTPPDLKSNLTPRYTNTYCNYPVLYPSPSAYCLSSPPNMTNRACNAYGGDWCDGWAENETGTIPAGLWTFGVNTTSTTSAGVGRILIYVWKVCAMNVSLKGYEVDTLLFRINGSLDRMSGGIVSETLTTNQPSFNFGGECYLILQYFLNVSDGTGNEGNKSTLVKSRGTNLTYPNSVKLVNNVVLNSPQTDPMLNKTQTFLMNCTPSTDDAAMGINMSFEYNYTGHAGFVEIPVSGTMLTANASTQVNARNATMYSRLITVAGGNDYYVRCRLYNSTANRTSAVQKVTARDPANLRIAEFRIIRGFDMSSYLTGTPVCTLMSVYESNLADPSICTSNLTSNTQYKAVIRICNDGGPFANPANISAVVHGKLNSTYIGTMGMCIAGNTTTPTPIYCDWNGNVTNGVYMNTSTMPAIQSGTSRIVSYSCSWYVYNFTTGSTKNSVSIYSNISTLGATSGTNPAVGNVTINVTSQSDMNSVTLDAPKSDLKLIDGSNFAMNCTPSTKGGYYVNVTFEYNSTTQGWGAIPISGGAFTISPNNTEVDVSNGVTYARNVYANSLGTYWVRCRMYNATNSNYSNVTRVNVYPGVLNLTLQYPSPDVYNITNPLVLGQYSTFVVNASVRCDSLGSGEACGNTFCSMRYNKTSSSADSFVSELQGATPFYTISANMTRNFTGIFRPSLSHQAMGGISYNVPPDNLPSSEATTQEYTYLGSEDGADWQTGVPYFNNISIFHYFRFQLNATASSIKKIKVYYKGRSVVNTTISTKCDTPLYLTRLYVKNFTSGNWSYIDGHSSSSDDVITGEFTSDFDNILSAGTLDIVASSSLSVKGCWANISTDFVKVDVEFLNETTLPCGNLMFNQTCEFSWIVNATGVNELRAFDVNCSSLKTTVAEVNSNDAYILFKGVNVKTDKDSYKSCGAVYYKVSVYNSDNNLVDDNLTIKVYNPSGSVVDESRASTTGGILYGMYTLPSGSRIGEWIIKISSCFVTNKTFGVGLGNASEFWKMDIIMPNRVEFLKSEKINFVFRVYNQLGEGMGISNGFIYIDDNYQGGVVSKCSKPRSGEWNCSITAPSSAGTHILNVTIFTTPRIVGETRYFYVGG